MVEPSIQAEWVVDPALPAFDGHFPGQPILPGVMILDAALQQLAIAQPTRRWTIRSAKFLSPVVPGERLAITVNPGTAGTWRFDVHVDGRRIATGQFEAHG